MENGKLPGVMGKWAGKQRIVPKWVLHTPCIQSKVVKWCNLECWLLAASQEVDPPVCAEDEKCRLFLMLQGKQSQHGSTERSTGKILPCSYGKLCQKHTFNFMCSSDWHLKKEGTDTMVIQHSLSWACIWKNSNLERYVHPNVHSSATYSSENRETTGEWI